MMRAFRKLVLREASRELDIAAERDFSIPTVLLMENAGRAVAEECLRLARENGLRRFLVVAGSGNNGGDGFCASKHIKNAGYEVEIVLVQREDKIKGDALLNLTIARKMGIPVHKISAEEELGPLLERTEVVVDAIFGTGLERDISDPFILAVIRRINEWRWKSAGQSAPRRKIVAVDIPSGLDSNTGIPRGDVIRADLTVTFAPPKVGLFVGDFRMVGELRVHDIGIPAELWQNSKFEIVDGQSVSRILRPRDPLAHKGNFGHLLCIAGGVGRAGAAILAGKAALRTGVGLVTLMVPEPIYDAVASGAKEYMVFPAPAEGRSFSKRSIELFEELAEGKTALLIGPGIWTYPGVRELLIRVIDFAQNHKTPVLFDADALNMIAELMPHAIHGAKAVITPHPGEAARIAHTTPQNIQKDRIRYAVELAKNTRSICVLKGARTIITDGDLVFINTSGGVELATGGTGDVLAGTIAGFLAQGYPPLQASLIGTYIHGLAGELAKRDRFSLSLAEQVCEKIQDAISLTLTESTEEP